MSRITKTYPVHQLKARDDLGTVEAIVSVFGNVDLVGDRVMPGAFLKSISTWRQKNMQGRYLPFVDEHDWSRAGRIGKVIEMEETPEGLKVVARLFMDQQSAKDVYGQMKEGVLGEFSFAYDVIRENKAADGANELLELDLLDASTALHGANPDTRLVAIKGAEPVEVTEEPEPEGDAVLRVAEQILAKVGRVISSKNEQKIRGAVGALQEVLASLGGEEPDGEASAAKSEPEPIDERPALSALRKQLDSIAAA